MKAECPRRAWRSSSWFASASLRADSRSAAGRPGEGKVLIRRFVRLPASAGGRMTPARHHGRASSERRRPRCIAPRAPRTGRDASPTQGFRPPGQFTQSFPFCHGPFTFWSRFLSGVVVPQGWADDPGCSARADPRAESRSSGKQCRTSGYRVRRDNKGGGVTLRYQRRLHHIGLGRADQRWRVLLVVAGEGFEPSTFGL